MEITANSKWMVLVVVLVCGTTSVLLCSAVNPTASYTVDNQCGSRASFCPVVHNTSGSLAFVDLYPLQPMIQNMSCFFLSCCVGNRPDVNSTWYRWDEESSEWTWLTDAGHGYRFTTDNGQALEFFSPGILSGTGLFRCVAADRHSTINRTFDVHVVDCRNNPATIVYSKPSSDIQASLGEEFVQECSGDFGCFGAVDSTNTVWWSYLDEHGHMTNLTNGTEHGRYEVRQSISFDKTEKRQVLTILGVQEVDFRRTFFCHMKMKDHHSVGFNFTLTQTGVKTILRKYIPLIVGLGVPFLLIVIVAGLTGALCFPVVAFSVQSVTNRLPKREKHTHDVLLVSREEAEDGEDQGDDTAVLRSMNDKLHSLGYKVLMAPSSGSRMARLDNVQFCVSVIFVISSSQLKQMKHDYLPEMDRLFSNAAGERAHIIFVFTERLTGREWEVLSHSYRAAYNLAPKVCTVLTWPGDPEATKGSSSRKERNFWSQLRRYLPRAAGVAGGEDENRQQEYEGLLV